MDKFDELVVSFLRTENYSDLWWAGDFYQACCKFLSLDFNDIKKNSIKIRKKLNVMVKSGKIKVITAGTGYGGRELYGFSHNNTYYI